MTTDADRLQAIAELRDRLYATYREVLSIQNTGLCPCTSYQLCHRHHSAVVHLSLSIAHLDQAKKVLESEVMAIECLMEYTA